jgi:hypothetical protein
MISRIWKSVKGRVELWFDLFVFAEPGLDEGIAESRTGKIGGKQQTPLSRNAVLHLDGRG